MWEAIKAEALELLQFLLTALLSVGTAYAISYLRRLREALNERSNHEFVQNTLRRVWHLVEVAVLATEAVSAAAIRQAVREGRTSRDELVALGRAVVDDVLGQLNDEARLALAATVGDVRVYIEQLVEAQLERLKGEGVIGRVGELADPKSSPA